MKDLGSSQGRLEIAGYHPDKDDNLSTAFVSSMRKEAQEHSGSRACIDKTPVKGGLVLPVNLLSTWVSRDDLSSAQMRMALIVVMSSTTKCFFCRHHKKKQLEEHDNEASG